MGCGCGNNTPNNNPAQQSQCKPRCNSCPGSVQPEMIRMSRNVNASCTPSCSKTPKCCTRKEWLSGIDCSGMGFNLDNAELGVEQGAIARLRAVYKNSAGSYVDPVEPRITIKGPCGKVFLSNQGLTRQDIGRYFFLFGTDGNTDYGLWSAEVTGVVLENGNNIRVTGQYYFAVLPCGSIPFNNCNDGYGPDGYGDGYGCDGYGDGYGQCGQSHCGHGIQSGADGYGTFAGREECGFDGCKSADIPATGGCRTNRNGVGDGFWDGISYESSCITPIGKRGMCMKDRAVAMTRVRLKDIEPKCVTGDTIVTSQLGHKKIRDTQENDLLWVYDPETKEYSYQPVKKLLINQTKTGKIVKITTKRGRELKCTPNHKIVTDNGLIEAKDIEVGMKTAVNPLATTNSIEFDKEEIFFTYNQFLEAFPETVNKTREEVEKWFPIKGQIAVIFARLVGFIFGDGHLCKDRSGVVFASDSIEELQAIQKDLKDIGILNSTIESRMGKVTAQLVNGNQKEYFGTTTYFNVISAAFNKTLLMIGTPSGDKAVQSYVIPGWIFGNKWLLRNFLSAYYGADGCDVINSTGIREINFSFNKDKEIDVNEFVNQWKQAFGVFGIPLRVKEDPNSGAIRKKDGKITTKYSLVPECSEAEGIIKFAEQIGCCYHSVKAQNLAVASEYLREIEVIRKENKNEKEKVFQYLKDGLSRIEIINILHPTMNKKQQKIVWSKYNRWIEGDEEATKQVLKNIQRWNEVQQKIYNYVLAQPKEKTNGEIAREILDKFIEEIEICKMSKKYGSLWAISKKWRNGRMPDSERYDYCEKDFVEGKEGSREVGIDYSLCSFKDWKQQYMKDNLYFDSIVKVETFTSNEDVYDCMFEKVYLFAESVVMMDCWSFSEDEIDLQLETSLSDFNAWPAFTCFTWDTLPENFLGVITLGAQVFSLFAQGLLESGREFSISDNGISLVPPAISGYMQTSASTLLASYTEMKEKIKANIKPSPAGIGTFRVMSILPGLSRLRHLRAKQII